LFPDARNELQHSLRSNLPRELSAVFQLGNLLAFYDADGCFALFQRQLEATAQMQLGRLRDGACTSRQIETVSALEV
jgi:hypothetical protein